MTDDLKPRSHIGAVIGTAIAVGSAVWGATSWLNSRADKPAVEKIANDSFQNRLDMEVVKGEIKAINIRIEEGFKAVGARLDSQNEPRKKR